ncbi:DUF4374 domain-containing protein [Aureibacter tunicatorum]|uniref:DUF4374 domain-containing protein n=1 Tax=Aureibacter tunicatorum TaxID=866807 RepID=A0AAE4BV11_9BACT|nr:DUF4374 domain-containing protein [Aureibacter tunicatorum]MDR6241392.1 hypothetical protein [Aureibacter tunicatorum]BDD06763.1 hypothetical protein AUTU_42460 [Aureibacter tunicatorum]
MKKLNLIFLFALSCMLTFTACNNGESDEPTPTPTPTPEPEPEPDPELLEWGVYLKLDAERDPAETEYLIGGIDLMEGEITAEGKGYEFLGWNFVRSVDKTVFVSGYGDNICRSYTLADDDKFVENGGSFIFDNAIEIFGHTSDNKTMLAIETNRQGFDNSLLYFVDAKTGNVTKKVSLEIYTDQEKDQKSLPSALVVRGDKLYVPFHVVDATGGYSYPDPNNAYVAVYPYPDVTATPEKIISDNRTSNIGTNGFTTGLILADDENLYSYSCGTLSSGFAPASTNPSGILRINNATNDFDENYFINTEEVAGGQIFWMDYVGDNKVLARVLVDDHLYSDITQVNEQGAPIYAWAAYGRSIFHQKLVIIDLVAQTSTDVKDVPLHAKRYTSPLLVDEGKAYVSVETAQDAYVYQIDVETATAVKGAKINGKTIKGFFKLR